MADRAAQRRRARHAGQGQARRVPTFVLVLAVVVVAGIVTIVLVGGGGNGDRPTVAQETAPVSVAGEPLPVLQQGQPDPAAGQPAPEVTGQDYDGSTVSIGGGGDPTVVLFLAHWCPVCQDEITEVQSWLDAEGDPDGVRLVAVATGVDSSRPNYPPSRWFQREGWTSPVLRDDEAGTVFSVYGLQAYPAWAFLDGDGNLMARTTGRIAVADLEQILDALRG
jgi:cytochrome c biogenesis protein CcmG, thiol:disulfide interchange protein DsbE